MGNVKRYKRIFVGFLFWLTFAVIVAVLFLPTFNLFPPKCIGARCAARVEELSQGAGLYKADWSRYPAQEYVLQAASGPTTQCRRKMTTSEIFARALLTDTDGKFPAATYASFSSSDLIMFNGIANLLSDRYKNPMPILYYPSRIGEQGMAVYDQADNVAITAGHTGGDFKEFITSNKKSSDGQPLPVKADEYIIVAAGPDRLYFTADDYTNFCLK